MNWHDPSNALIYKSAPILERRKRILREARRLIAETGYENFSIRELARRAKVAEKTLYNAFGSKEGIVCSAFVQFAQDHLKKIDLAGTSPSLASTLERMVHFNTQNFQMRSYLVAIMAINNSPTAEPTVRQTVRNLSVEPNVQLGNVLHERKRLAEFITPRIFAERLASFIGAAHTDWCVGNVPDSSMVEWICESYLIGFAGLTTGTAKREAQQWIAAIRAHGSRWTELCDKVRLSIQKPKPGDSRPSGGSLYR
jgi:AcrR family transcriptional regulator